MLYCETCQTLYPEGEKCPLCHKNRGRTPQPEDVCFLTEKGPIESAMLEDVLRQNGVPCLKKSVSGAGIAMYTGLMLESFRVYVHFAQLEKARAIADELLDAPIAEGEWNDEDEAEEGEGEDEPDDDQE